MELYYIRDSERIYAFAAINRLNRMNDLVSAKYRLIIIILKERIQYIIMINKKTSISFWIIKANIANFT